VPVIIYMLGLQHFLYMMHDKDNISNAQH